MRSHCIRKEGRKAGCHRAKCMSMVTICQARRVPIVAVLTIRNQVAHQGLQGHVALRTKAFYRRTGLLLSPTSTEQKWQISETPFSPANVNMCELSSNTKLSPAFTRVIINHPIDHSHYIIAILSLYRLSHICHIPHTLYKKLWKINIFTVRTVNQLCHTISMCQLVVELASWS
jgi:hypothetical protein